MIQERDLAEFEKITFIKRNDVHAILDMAVKSVTGVIRFSVGMRSASGLIAHYKRRARELFPSESFEFARARNREGNWVYVKHKRV